MATVLAWGKTRVVTYSNDHRPSHVHVIAPGKLAVFWLRCPEGPPDLRGSEGDRLAELNEVLARLMATLTDLCKQWERIHGNF